MSGLALAMPAGAAALPGDPPIEAQAPADGATLPVDPDGIPVAFTCPVYRISDAGGGFVLYGGAKDYGVHLSRSPALGADGRLQDPVAITRATETPPSGSAQCTSRLGAAGSDRPQETPGRYYWQAWRLCTGCALGYEVGPVRALTLVSEATATVRPPKRAWAGFPFALAVAVPGVPDGTQVRLERKAGSRWKRLGTTQALGERAEAVLSLRRGRHTLRAAATVGDQRVVSAGKRLLVRRAARWSTSPRDDGAYRGRVPARSVRFKVTGGGRQMKRFSASVAMLCPGVVPGEFTTQVGTAAVRVIKIAPDGSFLAASTPERATAILVRGRLRGGRVSGEAKLSVGACSGSLRFTARR